MRCALLNQGATASGFTDSATDASCGFDEDDDGWYSFTVPSNDNVTITVTGTGGADMVLTIFSGGPGCSGLTQIQCVDSGFSNGTETITFSATTGVNYYVHVFEYFTGGGDFTICGVLGSPGGATADCSGATQICGDNPISTAPSGPGADDFSPRW